MQRGLVAPALCEPKRVSERRVSLTSGLAGIWGVVK
jgi:hypothetical protein